MLVRPLLKKEMWRPPTKRALTPTAFTPVIDDIVADDINETLSTLYLVRRHRRKPAPAAPQVSAPPEPIPYNDDETALKQIHTSNLQDNVDLTCRTAPTRPATHNNIPQVTETLQPVNMDRHFPCLHPLTTAYSKDLQLKTCKDVPLQKVSIKSLTS